jgi:hypothetical protein
LVIHYLLLPRVQQNSLHPFGGANVHWTFATTPPHPASAGMTIKEVVISAPTKAFKGRLQWDKNIRRELIKACHARGGGHPGFAYHPRVSGDSAALSTFTFMSQKWGQSTVLANIQNNCDLIPVVWYRKGGHTFLLCAYAEIDLSCSSFVSLSCS